MPRNARDAEPMARLKERLRTLLSRRDFEEIESMLGEMATDDPAEFEGGPRTGGEQWPNHMGAEDGRTFAMDAALPGDREVAISMVESRVGRAVVMGCNNAAAVFRSALTALGCDSARTVAASALPEMWRLQTQIQASRGADGQPMPPRRDPAVAAGFDRLVGRSVRVL